MIAKLTVAAGAFIVIVVVAASSAFIAYRQGLVNGLDVAERAAAARLRGDVEIASAIRLGESIHALRLLDMEIDSVVLVLHGVGQQNVGVMSVLASGRRTRPGRSVPRSATDRWCRRQDLGPAT